MATTKATTTNRRKPAGQKQQIVRRQCADEMVEFRLVITCPGCHRRDCTGFKKEVESKVVHCAWCGTTSGPMAVTERKADWRLCNYCQRPIRVDVPRGGDGSAVRMRRHKASSGEVCAGSFEDMD